MEFQVVTDVVCCFLEFQQTVACWFLEFQVTTVSCWFLEFQVATVACWFLEVQVATVACWFLEVQVATVACWFLLEFLHSSYDSELNTFVTFSKSITLFNGIAGSCNVNLKNKV